MMAYLSTYYKKTMLGWGFLIDPIFSDNDRFPYLTKVIPDSLKMMETLVPLFRMFEWNRVAIFYTPNEVQYCDTIIDDADTAFGDDSTYVINIVQKVTWDGQDNDYIRDQLHRTKNNARSQVARGNRVANMRLEIHCDEFQVDLNGDDVDPQKLKDFRENVVARVRNDPLYCDTQACLSNDGKTMATWARHLHDVFYLYGLALNDSLTMDPSGGHSNASTLTEAMKRSFVGLTGLVTINANGSRIPLFSVYVLDDNFNQVTAINFTITDGVAVITARYRWTKTIADLFEVMTKGYTDEATTLWGTRGGRRPLVRPKCGYTGADCPKPFWEQHGIYVVVGAGLIAILLIATVVLIVYAVRIRKEEEKQQRSLWQIPSMKLRKPPTSRELQQESKRSLQSGPSTITGDSRLTQSNFGDYEIYFLENDAVLTKTYPAVGLTDDDKSIFPQMRKLDHDNVNRFVGLSIDGSEYIAVWRMCSRGTLQRIRSLLQELISKGSLWFDPFFMLCIMRDIAEGTRFLQNSIIGCHGRLSSRSCLVTDSWQVKISDYGTDSLREDERLKKRRLLWLAPEHLRSPETSMKKSKEGDIYSFAIVASEVVTRKAAWNLHERKERIDELLYMLKKGGPAPPRPDLNVDGEINVAVLHLIRDCWNEKPADRPNCETLCNMLKAIMPDKKSNLMDHMFDMLEDYTTTLELDVEERTKQLQEEKKKADILLGKMLPRQVADRLKLGQAVEPESFDSVTVFFSDVVKFTQLAAKCTPFQVVNLLNDLYNGFDSIIEEHTIYKVESIGDGYLCVSGLPVRNGTAHIKEIAELSLSFMKFVEEFRILALPRERVQLRIGLNSGPCVAGVVGLSMPRYCLFGDTVNTASRMESNGKPGHIHMSKGAHDLLVNEYHADYETQSRGEVIIKGKGVMETFWLIGRRAASSAGLPSEERAEQKTEKHSEQLKDDPNNPAELSAPETTPPSTPGSVSSNTMYKEYLRSNTIEAY
ncbi:unnamed protein product [Haemonchus placei]|uniref:Guanylate cyclase n=1 Tax=Haemonchus placei TaxID=6290 RepID=A0A158QQF5_HAEPC|nr:unnamed protein product [Haemonchus placei]